MWIDPTLYDVIVVGGGHAGCEAGFASASLKAKTLLLTFNLDALAKASCNPAIGGTAKGHIVREIDALGGIMGKIADETAIHLRLLNSSKGPAVQSPRVQIDKALYSLAMKKTLEQRENLFLRQARVLALSKTLENIFHVTTEEGVIFQAKSVVVSTGTFLQGLMHLGNHSFEGGRSGDLSAKHLSNSLTQLGFTLGRLKTGTPARLHARSIDYSKLEIQPSEENIFFSFDHPSHPLKPISCFIAYTNQKTKEIILKNLSKSALYSGNIKSVGPRYCPSIEDKMVRFSDKLRHQVFIEPEGIHTDEVYVNGLSTSLPIECQEEFIHSIEGLEKAEILRPAYAIEYDYLISGQIHPTLESKKIPSLFFAGQINGTTGYEEAAAQGLIAGVNAAKKALNEEPFFLPRSSSYIGVMIDDLIIKTLDEPYRMFTSRAEYRLLLRHDNADLRLREYGYNIGLISKNQFETLQQKRKIIQEEKERFASTFVSFEKESLSLTQLISRPEMGYEKLLLLFNEKVKDHGKEINFAIEVEIKYIGYISRQEKEIVKLSSLEKIEIPPNFPFEQVIGLRNEAREKLKKYTPSTLASASLIHGVSIADISILKVALSKIHS